MATDKLKIAEVYVPKCVMQDNLSYSIIYRNNFNGNNWINYTRHHSRYLCHVETDPLNVLQVRAFFDQVSISMINIDAYPVKLNETQLSGST